MYVHTHLKVHCQPEDHLHCIRGCSVAVVQLSSCCGHYCRQQQTIHFPYAWLLHALPAEPSVSQAYSNDGHAECESSATASTPVGNNGQAINGSSAAAATSASHGSDTDVINVINGALLTDHKSIAVINPCSSAGSTTAVTDLTAGSDDSHDESSTVASSQSAVSHEPKQAADSSSSTDTGSTSAGSRQDAVDYGSSAVADHLPELKK